MHNVHHRMIRVWLLLLAQMELTLKYIQFYTNYGEHGTKITAFGRCSTLEGLHPLYTTHNVSDGGRHPVICWMKPLLQIGAAVSCGSVPQVHVVVPPWQLNKLVWHHEEFSVTATVTLGLFPLPSFCSLSSSFNSASFFLTYQYVCVSALDSPSPLLSFTIQVRILARPLPSSPPTPLGNEPIQ